MLTAVQFGWRCRDDKFSIEWDSQEDAQTRSGGSHMLTFDEESREIKIIMSDGGSDEGPWGLEVFRSFIVASRYSRVESLTLEEVQGAPPALIFTFSCPPALEEECVIDDMDFGRAMRARVTGFSPSHKQIVPFASLAIRLQCRSKREVDKFLQMAKTAHLPRPNISHSPPVKRNLFKSNVVEIVNSWIARLEWPVAFQCTAILADLLVDPRELWALRGAIVAMVEELGALKTSEVLRQFRARLKILYWEGAEEDGLDTVAACLVESKRDASELHMTLRNQTQDDALFDCLHLTCTPTRNLLDGPFPDQSNRVLRRYPNHQDCFLRVNFTDEESLHFRWDRDVNGADFIRQRVGGTLKNGITIGGRKFEFLAYSYSALRDHAVWFCMPFDDANGERVTAASIRASLGNFAKVRRCPARYGARLSQAFTATEPSITLVAEEVFTIPDIVVRSPQGKESNFTDGIGTISRKLADDIASAIERRPGNKKKFWYRPSAYQVRIGGYKGVLSVDYTLSDSAIYVRPSMNKFDAPESLDIEIASVFYRPLPMYLNRPLIMILETLGVPVETFITYQDRAVENVHGATESLDTCARFLDAHGCGTAFRLSSVFLSLHRLGVGLVDGEKLRTLKDPFLDRAIEFAANYALRELKYKTRLPVKGSYTLVGVADVHGYLAPDSVFVCIRDKDSKPDYLEGQVLITRSPQVHPGDVQLVRAIGKPPPGSPFEHEEFPNCVVFSSKGSRSLPSMLAGGDLDGDLYNVITNTDLFPRRVVEPADYNPAVLKRLNRDCTIGDLADWVVDYINSDILGLVASQFLIIADQSPSMACDPKCIQLAALASAAVDFGKSGTPVTRNQIPRPPQNGRPDWAIGEMVNARARGTTYESKRAIGVLYRRINLSDIGRKANWASKQAQKKEKERLRRPSKKNEPLVNAMELLTLSGPSFLHDTISQTLIPVVRPYVDLQSSIPADLTIAVNDQFVAYVDELRMICAASSLSVRPLSEEEALIGVISTYTTQPKKRYDLTARLRDQSSELTKRMMLEIAGKAGKQETGENLQEWVLRGWVAWQFSVSEGDSFGARSFGWIALAAIFEAIHAIEAKEKSKK